MTQQTQAQPLAQTLTTGFIGIALVLAIAALCVFPFQPDVFTAWVATAFMAATPAQIILGLLWQNAKPDFVAPLAQPLKGLALTAIAIATGAVVLGAILLLVGGGHGPTPMLVQFTIMSVVAILWMVPIWQCWPLTKVNGDPLVFGILTLLASYLLAYLLWMTFFNYGVLGQLGHPAYHEDIDPGGLFDMWVALSFFVTTGGVIVVHVLFDFWPIEKLSPSASQPVRGLVGSLYVLALAWAIRAAFVDGLGMEQVEYMVRVPVCMIFGTFLVHSMMQASLFTNLAQPVRGLALTGCALVAAVVMYELYAAASTWHAGQVLGMGPQGGFAKEIWIASAMLGVTFPVIFVVSGFFDFWPIRRITEKADKAAIEQSSD